ncbi:hypothetical protein [Mucilaginibacter polytrichastri]|uniref:CHAT domain-containing protein n=1 Tax=Mucilaginibacter polytrichastri TaxID=1302689 RepID=A0A1Q6A3X4_9SPHI|nr:hypothetical protein [Mucilaginibacter polytrichastri]OKS88702.1 hypothetical protein RG47T_4180 [Mucilaginibacter polytrichastri]SFT04615.1 hypothetical protein SAMN04487890_10934 [Mucilaginibacter polytrichastri]
MILFSQIITNIIIIDFLPELNLASELEEYCKSQAPTTLISPEDEQDFLNILKIIAKGAPEEGVLIHLLAHGNIDRSYFGKNSDFKFPWSIFGEPLTAINQKCGGRLIINASLTCYSEPLMFLKYAHRDIYHAAIFSTTERSPQAIMQNINIYNKCINSDSVVSAITQENDAISDGSEPPIRPFAYIGC